VRSIDLGVIGRFSGAYLEDEGLYIQTVPYSSSQVFTIEPVAVGARQPPH
jgi:hypothetical protein